MDPSFVKPEFRKVYSGFLKRFKQPEIAKTLEKLKAFDILGGKLQAKNLLQKDRTPLVKELEETMVKLKKQLTLELEFRKKQLDANIEMPPKGFQEVPARLNFKNVKRELKTLTEKAQQFADNGGGAPPEPKAPEFHFKPDYERIVPAILRDAGVISALDKLDENADIKKVLQLFNAGQTAVKTQIAEVTESIKDCTAAKKGGAGETHWRLERLSAGPGDDGGPSVLAEHEVMKPTAPRAFPRSPYRLAAGVSR